MPNVLILDCGATNLRAIVIDEKGHIKAQHHLANATESDPYDSHFYIWNFDTIWEKLVLCVQHVITTLKQSNLELPQAIGVTTFGVDGAPFDKDNKQIAPIISWKCQRTVPIMQSLPDWMDIERLYRINGVGQYSFNTLFKLRWLQSNQADIYTKMDKFVFISSMITFRLTGLMTTDRTMAGTSMMTNLHSGQWESEILDKLALEETHFPPMVDAGKVIGYTTKESTQTLGLHQAIPVISCGHDTQFAILGSGADFNQPVLSSGTWEILMARTLHANPNYDYIDRGLTTEFDTVTGYYNPAVQWIGSGMLEWIARLLYSDVYGTEHLYHTMIKEAENQSVGCDGLSIGGDFATAQGFISGLSITASRGAIYRAALEGLAKKLKIGLETLQKVGSFKAQHIICVGGGVKNKLWNQIRADVLNLPLEINNVAESTVLGAAMTTLYGIGHYPSIEAAQRAMKAQCQRIEPSQYTSLYQQWLTH